jgi:aminopeptidase N
MVRITFIFLLSILISSSLSYGQLIDEALLKSEFEAAQYHKLNKKSVAGDEYDIVYHRLEFKVNPESKRLIGAITSHFKPLINSFAIVKFDFVNKFVIDSIIYHGQRITDYSYSAVQLAITLPDTVALGVLDSIKVCYQGSPGDHTQRSYVQEGARPKDDHGVVFTLSEPYGARDWWPCKQSLTDKIDSIDILVTVPKGNKVASNGILLYEKDINVDEVLVHWRHRYPIVTYLVAIGVTNYAEFSDWVFFKNGKNLEIVNYVYPEALSGERERARRTVDLMYLFDSLYGEYPFIDEKYGHAQFGFSGGMEHQTMSFMSDWNFGLVAHELAHQWFGNQVTCGSWQDLWLNESFATHLTLVAYEFLEPKEAWMGQIKNTGDNVKSENGGSVFVYPQDTSNINRLFSGRLTYRKGALVLRMLRWKLGDDIFFKACREYLADDATTYGFAKTADLQRVFEEVSGVDLTKFFRDWIYSEGFPIFEAAWGVSNNFTELNIKQTTSHSSVKFFEIPIPVRFSNTVNDTTVVVNPTSNLSAHSFKLAFVPDKMEFDPEQKLLAKYTVLHDDGGFNSITLYPNPGNGLLTVLFAPHQMSNIKLYDMSGRLVLEEEIEAKGLSEKTIDVTSLSPGAYLVQVNSKTKVINSLYIKNLAR